MKYTAKKGLFVLVLAVIAVMCAYADPPKFGFRSLWVGGYFTGDGDFTQDEDYVGSVTTFYGGGWFVALDLTFVEASYGMFWGNAEVTESYAVGLFGTDFTSHSSFISPGHDIGIYGKYPHNLFSNLYIYPLLGLNYRIASADLSTLWLKVGGGFDIVSSNTGGIFRLDAMYGLRFPNSNGLHFGHGVDIRVGFHILTPFFALFGFLSGGWL